MNDLIPAFAGPVLIRHNRGKCLLPENEVTFEAPAALIRGVFELCDGDRTVDEVLSALEGGWNRRRARDFMRSLHSAGVIVDARGLARAAWSYVENPARVEPRTDAEVIRRLQREATRRTRGIRADFFLRPRRTLVGSVLERRLSIRTFSGEPMRTREITALLASAYAILKRSAPENGFRYARRTVPSAGGLYPLRIFLINLRPARGLAPGIYRIAYGSDQRIGFTRLTSGTSEIAACFSNPEYLCHAQAVLAVAGSFFLTGRKYSNRSLLYVSLEAGHVVQNVLTVAAELGIGAAEIGAFMEAPLGRALRLHVDQVPLSTVVFGGKPSRAEATLHRSLPETEFRWGYTEAAGYRLPYHLGLARIASSGDDWCFGRSTDAANAYDKAIAEAFERHACGQPSGLERARFSDLARAIAPTEIASYSAAQHARQGFPYAPFRADREIPWKRATDLLSGKDVFVPADCVYFASELDRLGFARRHTSASTSGVAAYPSFEGALVRATLEALERDAFMATCVPRRETARIDPRSLPAPIARRLRALEDAGLVVALKDISLDTVPIACAFGQHRERHFTCVGAAASFDPEDAVERALAELEGIVLARLQRKDMPPMEPARVRSAEDHTVLYAQRRYFRRADFLARSGGTVRMKAMAPRGPRNAHQLYAAIQDLGMRITWVDMTPPRAALAQGRTPLHVVRVLVPGLIPMSFGYGTEPLGVPRLRSYAGRIREPLFPHPLG
jgi:ribosomal protein S12 methylthiotransferase accessory factor